MGLNIKAIKKGVEKGIKLNPTTISLMRENRVDDGYGGHYIDKDNPYLLVTKEDIYLNEASSSISTNGQNYSDGGRKSGITNVSALILYSKKFTVKEGDFFIYKGKKYIIKYPLNMYDVYWSVSLEVVLDAEQ